MQLHNRLCHLKHYCFSSNFRTTKPQECVKLTIDNGLKEWKNKDEMRKEFPTRFYFKAATNFLLWDNCLGYQFENLSLTTCFSDPQLMENFVTKHSYKSTYSTLSLQAKWLLDHSFTQNLQSLWIHNNEAHSKYWKTFYISIYRFTITK
jgi:hypothetical protein